MDQMILEAVRVAIVTEKNSLDFYRSTAAKVHDGSVRRLFERLADEEARHLELLLGHYSGSDFGNLQSLLAHPAHLTSPLHKSLLVDMAGITDEIEALELALQEKDLCFELYSVLEATIREPAIHAVFRLAMDETLRHTQILKEKYLHINGNGRSNRSGRLRTEGDRHGNQEYMAAAGQDFGTGGTSAGQ